MEVPTCDLYECECDTRNVNNKPSILLPEYLKKAKIITWVFLYFSVSFAYFWEKKNIFQ